AFGGSVLSSTLRTPVDPVAGIRISVHEDLYEIEGLWRAFEATAVRSIYQRFDWLSRWVAEVAETVRMVPQVVVGSRSNGEPLFLLPFGKRRCALGQVVNWLGGSHCNINLGLY